MAKKVFEKMMGLSAAELKTRAAELEEKLFRARIQKSIGQLNGYSQVWKMRKELARVRTAMTQKTLG